MRKWWLDFYAGILLFTGLNGPISLYGLFLTII